ncbi:MAG TPA: hypothetical protein PLX89_22755 [Verrucomicrobiota bacterium]|nr:hypothetical protein [Verrucomicrobiota bacterium]
MNRAHRSFINGWKLLPPTQFFEQRTQAPTALPLSIPCCFGAAANCFGFLISWPTNAAVVVEASPAPNWTPLSTNTLTAGTSQFTDPQRTNSPTRFYRVQP